MNAEEYLIGAPRWVLPAALIGAVLVVTVLVNYWFGGMRGWRFAALLLKVVGIAILVICLVEPMGRGQRPRPQANILPIVVDTSQSMRVRNQENMASDADRLRQHLDRQLEWVKRVEHTFDVRRYAFDSRLDRVEDFVDQKFDGTASNLATSLKTLADRYRGRAVAGCLLVTDGNATDDVNHVRWSELGFPVFPVRDPDSSEIRDLRIGTVAVTQTDFETAPVTIDVGVAATGLAERDIVVRLIDAADRLIDEQTVTTSADASEVAVRFRFRPQSAGVSFYRAACVLSDEVDLETSGNSTVEATARNNSRLVVVNQRRGPYEVLYVGGRPNWEFKFLRRALQEDAEVRLVSLLRIAKKQPKFSFGDRHVESSANPLFAGLGGEEEEAAEQLDEPVILRLGVNDAGELAGGFPKESDELFPFSAVILDDVEADFFTQDQLLLLRQFVSSRGGALLILGGEDSLNRGRYADTPLAELAPVYLPRPGDIEDESVDGPSGSYRMELTREGLLQPFLRMRGTEQAEAARLNALPSLHVLNQVERIKPGAVVLAVARDASGATHPALVTQSFGRGKTASLMLGDLWQWFLRRDVDHHAAPSGGLFRTAQDSPPADRDDPAQAWRQIIRWLVSDVTRRIEAAVEPGDVPGVVRIVSQVRGVDFLPVDGAGVSVEVKTPEGTLVELDAEPDVDQAGVYQAEFWPRTPGGYRFQVTATAADGTRIGVAETGWASDPAGQEFERLGSNHELLDRIARETGGRVIELEELDRFASALERRPVPVTETWVFPLWHRPWVLVLAIGCLCGEWGIRRWKGLP